MCYVKKNLNFDKFIFVSEYFFKGILCSPSKLNEWKKKCELCFFTSIDLAMCLLSYWCDKNTTHNLSSEEIINFIEILKIICSLDGKNRYKRELKLGYMHYGVCFPLSLF